MRMLQLLAALLCFDQGTNGGGGGTATAEPAAKPSPLARFFDGDGCLRSDALPEDSPGWLGSLLETVRGIQVTTDEQAREQTATITTLEQRLVTAEEASRERFSAAAGKVDDPKPKISLSRLLSHVYSGADRSRLDGYEAEVLQEDDSVRMANLHDSARTMATSGDPGGGYVVPTQYLPNEMIEMLAANAIVRNLGARVLSGLTSESVPIGKITGRPTSYYTAEGADITESELSLGDITLRPRELCTLVPVTSRLLQMGVPSVDRMIMEEIAVSQALREDLAFLRGTGETNTPIGVTNWPSVQATTMSAVPDKTALRAMKKKLKDENAYTGRLGWAMSVDAKDYIEGLDDGTGRPLFPNTLATDGSENLLGHPWKDTTQIPSTLGSGAATQIIFGDWSQMIIAEWGSVMFDRTETHGTNFAKRIWVIRACRLHDMMIRHAEAFCSDITVLTA